MKDTITVNGQEFDKAWHTPGHPAPSEYIYFNKTWYIPTAKPAERMYTEAEVINLLASYSECLTGDIDKEHIESFLEWEAQNPNPDTLNP